RRARLIHLERGARPHRNPAPNPGPLGGRKDGGETSPVRMAIEKQRRVLQLRMAGLFAKVLQPFIEQALGPEATLHRIAKEYEDRQMQLAGEIAEIWTAEESFAAAVTRDDDHAFRILDVAGQPEIERHILALPFA